jgi:hypothetical protein
MGVTKGRVSQSERGKICGQDVLARYAPPGRATPPSDLLRRRRHHRHPLTIARPRTALQSWSHHPPPTAGSRGSGGRRNPIPALTTQSAASVSSIHGRRSRTRRSSVRSTTCPGSRGSRGRQAPPGPQWL